MRLKRLEIQGFKSFARPVSLEFGPGITAIVGPNGSGKSNISDAIRWVLGEQSARSLRGQRMEDIIFAGSDGKRPLGMAEVQLTLDNLEGFLPLDYGEVSITRRVYRSGESEFFINKQSCRLKDIRDLFTDTGLGREGCAIIGQGQLDAILSVRSEDRRILLEETAGIVKYRLRKEEALRKLETTDMDLLRITDLLHELESQLGPLGKQAEKARTYLALMDELKEAELDYFHVLWGKLAKKEQDALVKQKLLEEENEAASAAYTELLREKAELEAALKQLEAGVEAEQEELIAETDAHNEGLHTIKLYSDRLTDHTKRCDELEQVIATYQKEAVQVSADMEALEREKERLNVLIAEQEKAVGQIQSELIEAQDEYNRIQTEINKLKDEFFAFMRSLADQRNVQRSFDDRRANLEAQIKGVAEELKRLDGQLATLSEQYEQLRLAEKALVEKDAEQKREEERLLKELRAQEILLKEKQEQYRQLEAKQTRLASRLNTLQELEEGYQGYALGVRRVMQDVQMSALVLGTVADVIKVPEGLETAYEVALGSALQNLITANEEDAKRIIAWLKNTNGGRVTFLPLDTVRGGEFSGEELALLKRPGVLGGALELIDFAPQFRPALAALLGRIAITEDLDTAFRLKRDMRRFARLVTRDGSVVYPSGAMTGGSWQGRTAGLLSRKAELNEMETELAEVKRLAEELADQGDQAARAISRLQERLEAVRSGQVELKLELQSTVQNREQIVRQQDGLRLRQAEMLEQLDELETVKANLSGEKEAAAAKVSDLEKEEETRRATIQALEQRLEDLAARLEAARSSDSEQRVSLVELKGDQQNLVTKCDNLLQRRNLLAQQVEDARGEQARLRFEQEEFSRIIQKVEGENEARTSRIAELKTSLSHKRAERQVAQEQIVALDLELSAKQKEQFSKERLLFRCEAELEQLAKEREQILTSLAERELTLENILERTASGTETGLKRQLDNLRTKVRDLGLVNPAAAQEYEAVQERCEFLRTQLDDLNEGRESLQSVIREMDKLCRTKLLEVFEQVNREFGQIFQRLFRGGKAELIMTDPESVLTTGIDVMAQPPGKKLQNLLLLSGGERSLTSIALVFAIRKIKPTPFCVLDEIDAALDESNLHRFTELLEDFSGQTQFLVITHRQTTMEAADTLYGVTMDEQAFSQVISVALT